MSDELEYFYQRQCIKCIFNPVTIELMGPIKANLTSCHIPCSTEFLACANCLNIHSLKAAPEVTEKIHWFLSIKTTSDTNLQASLCVHYARSSVKQSVGKIMVRTKS